MLKRLLFIVVENQYVKLILTTKDESIVFLIEAFYIILIS